MGSNLKEENSNQEEIKSRLKLGNACYHSVQNRLSSSFLSKNVKINPLNAELNPICHLLALLEAHHILHVSRIRVNGHFNPLNAGLNPICHLLALLEAHHILHVSRIRVKIHRITILPVVLYGCQTWSLTLREKRRVRVFRRIFGPKRDDVTGD